MTNWPLLTQVPYNEIKNFCLYHKNISTKIVMCDDCQQRQLMYEIHQVQNDNVYTSIKSIIKEEKK